MKKVNDFFNRIDNSTRLEKMKSISRWATKNSKKARLIIVCCHLLIMVSALFLGVLLFIFDWGISMGLVYLFGFLASIAFLFYPKRGRKNGVLCYSYARQKMHDYALVVFSAFVISLGLNNYITKHIHIYNLSPSTTMNTQNELPVPKFVVNKHDLDNQTPSPTIRKRDIRSGLRKMRKQIKQELKQLKKERGQQSKAASNNVSKMLLILLTIFVILFLGYVVTAIACNVACSGSEGIGLLILFGGWVGLAILGSYVIKLILGIRLKDKKGSENEVLYQR